MKKRVTDANTRLQRLQAALEAGADPSALVDAINAAQAERAAAQAELTNASERGELSTAEIHAKIDSLGDVGAALRDARHEKLGRLYKDPGALPQIRTTRADRGSYDLTACG